MAEPARIHRYFPGTHTGRGFISFFDSVLSGMERIFVLKGAPGTGRSTLLKSIGLAMLDRGFSVEILHRSTDSNSLDGVIIPEIKLAVVDGSAPHNYESKAPGEVGQPVNLGDYWDREFLQRSEAEIVAINQQADGLFAAVHKALKAAAELREEIRRVNAQQSGREQLSKLSEELLEEIFRPEPQVRHLFASAITPRGRINFLLNITEPWSRRYILQGVPGSGKSEIVGKIANAALERGLKVDMYHDPLEVDRVEAVVVPQLDLAVLAVEPDYSVEGLRDGDRIIELAQYLDKEKLEHSMIRSMATRQRYGELMQEAVDNLVAAKEINDRLEQYYIRAMNFEAVDSLKESILNKILATAATVRHSGKSIM